MKCIVKIVGWQNCGCVESQLKLIVGMLQSNKTQVHISNTHLREPLPEKYSEGTKGKWRTARTKDKSAMKIDGDKESR